GNSFTLMLFVSGLISVCVSEFHTVEVQPAEQVTLMCSNFSSFITYMFWFRLDSRPNISRISSMWSSDSNASVYDGFQNGKFNMTSNTTTLFLNINHVDLSDSGLYFCGFYSDGKTVIVSGTYLKVQGKIIKILLILGALTVLLLMIIIGLVVKITKLQKDAALSLYAATIRNRRPASEREVETHAVYAVCR
uniref:Ig-like domain-containing protein n=1 Tax=Sander lucioperca TaxID=283035 RepID=A0A8C9X833_SANLU